MKATRNGLPVDASAGSAGIPGVAAYTWATKPSAAANSGAMIKVTDVGPNGSFWVSNGTDWAPLNGQVTLARSAVAASVTGATDKTALATISIPAGLMGTNGQLRITTLWSNNNSANAKTFNVDFGGQAFFQASSTTNLSLQMMHIVRNRNSAASQVGFVSNVTTVFGASSGALRAATVDTASAVSLVLSATLANAADTATLEGYTVELIR